MDPETTPQPSSPQGQIPGPSAGSPESPAPVGLPAPNWPSSPPPPFVGEPHRGTAILVMGILSIVFTLTFWCSPVGLGLGIAAWCMGRKDLPKMDRNVMDPTGRQLTVGGKICGMVGTLLAVGMFLLGLIYFLIMGVILAAAAAGS